MGSVEYWQARAQEADARIVSLEAERDRYRVAMEDFSCRLLGLGMVREDIEGLLREHGIDPQDFDK
jgi:hypothetical protein